MLITLLNVRVDGRGIDSDVDTGFRDIFIININNATILVEVALYMRYHKMTDTEPDIRVIGINIPLCCMSKCWCTHNCNGEQGLGDVHSHFQSPFSFD